ncbi:hypothetical protein PENTCL1PPCAC_9514, partial [Pristionchus entomophagus]
LLSSLALGNANPLLKLVLTTEAMYKIQLHNLNPNRTYDMVFTKFSDQTPEEYKMSHGRRMTSVLPKSTYEWSENDYVPDSFAWRDKELFP